MRKGKLVPSRSQEVSDGLFWAVAIVVFTVVMLNVIMYGC